MKPRQFICLFLLAWLFHPGIFAQYNWRWTITGGNEYNDYITSVDCDIRGNIYATGVFQDTIVFFGDTIISQGYNDVFVSCFYPDGSLSWATTGGGKFEDTGLDLCTKSEFVYVTGIYHEMDISFKGSVIELNGSMLDPGLYFINIITRGKNNLIKMIKE